MNLPVSVQGLNRRVLRAVERWHAYMAKDKVDFDLSPCFQRNYHVRAYLYWLCDPNELINTNDAGMT